VKLIDEFGKMLTYKLFIIKIQQIF